MGKIKGNPVQGAEEYELLYFVEDVICAVCDYAAFLAQGEGIDANNNLVMEEGFIWSNFELPTNYFRVPYAYKVVVYYNDENGASHIVWSQDLNADNYYIVNPPTGLYEDDSQYELDVAICWRYEDVLDPYAAEMWCGEGIQWTTSDVIDFEVSDEGYYAVRAHGTGYDSSDLSNWVEYRL